MNYIGVKDLIAELKPEFDRIGKATKIAKSILKERGEKADKAIDCIWYIKRKK